MFKSRRTSLPYMSNHSERFTTSSMLKPVPFCTWPVLGGRQWHIKGTEWTGGTHNPSEGLLEPWRCHGNYITQTNLQLILLVSLNSLRRMLSLTACPGADHPTASSWYLSTGTRRPGLMSDFVLEWRDQFWQRNVTTHHNELTLSTGLLLSSFILTNMLDMYANQPGGKANGKLFFCLWLQMWLSDQKCMFNLLI